MVLPAQIERVVSHFVCFLPQLESVAECASRLRLLNKALDVSTLRLNSGEAPHRQELVRLQAAGLGLDIKESLLEACGLVLLANNQLDPHKSGEPTTFCADFFLDCRSWLIS